MGYYRFGYIHYKYYIYNIEYITRFRNTYHIYTVLQPLLERDETFKAYRHDQKENMIAADMNVENAASM